jgi:cytochrome b involved in lipid metabolism
MMRYNSVMKNELIVGVVGTVLILALTGYYGAQYMARQKSLESLRPAAGTGTPALTQPATAQLTAEEVAKHTNAQDCWFIINNGVYNVTQYIALHPGGADRILSSCGTDATQAFMTRGGDGQHSQTAVDTLKIFYIGELNGAVTAEPDTQKIQQLPVEEREDDD